MSPFQKNVPTLGLGVPDGSPKSNASVENDPRRQAGDILPCVPDSLTPQQGRSYRGQILPKNHLITVEAVVTEVLEGPRPAITAEGHLKVDGLYIYKMENFGIVLLPM